MNRLEKKVKALMKKVKELQKPYKKCCGADAKKKEYDQALADCTEEMLLIGDEATRLQKKLNELIKKVMELYNEQKNNIF
jgi:4-hydroxy-3-methylbut-2-enyl diphosphate reductase IspH